MTQKTHRLTALAAACLLVLTANADAASPRRLDDNGSANGEITSADRVNFNDGSRSVAFAVDLEQGQAVSLSANAVFCGRLALFSGDDGREMVVRALDAGCSEEGGRHAFEQSLVAPRSGRYTLAFSGRSANDYGPFSIAMTTIELQADRVMVAGDDVHGVLDGEEKALQLKVEEAGRYIIDLSSSEFDPLLRLSGEGVQREDDDGGEGDNYDSRLAVYLQPGDYRLGVARVGDTGGGMYRLKIARSDFRLPAGTALQNDGDLKAGGLTGMLEGSGTTYRLVLAERSRVGFVLDSGDFDPRIKVTGPGTTIGDDDSGDGTNAHLVTTLAAGTYTVAIDDAVDSNAGVFTLQTTIAPASGSALRLQAGTAVQGGVTAGEQQRYALTVDRAGVYVIGLRSTDFDSVLTVMRDGEVVGHNDDPEGSDSTDARLMLDLEPGVYEVIAMAYDGGSGDYTLEAARR